MFSELLRTTQAERDEAIRRAQANVNVEATNISKDLIPRPAAFRSFKVVALREMLGLGDNSRKDEWNHIRVCVCTHDHGFIHYLAPIQEVVRDKMARGGVEWDTDWKSQQPFKLGKIYRAVRLQMHPLITFSRHDPSQIEETIPALKQFRGSWATAFLVKEAFASRKAHISSKKRENSYRKRRQRERLEQIQRNAATSSGGGSSGSNNNDDDDDQDMYFDGVPEEDPDINIHSDDGDDGNEFGGDLAPIDEDDEDNEGEYGVGMLMD
jgi:hypothetical protein